MKPLKKYIYNGLFSKSGFNPTISGNEVMLNELKKYSQTNDSDDVWNNGRVYADERGIVVEFPQSSNIRNSKLDLSNINTKTPPKFNIYKITGSGTIYIADNKIETLEGIFNKDCICNGLIKLDIFSNPNLKSLHWCPKKVEVFDCSHNPSLNDWDGAPKEAQCWDYLDSYKDVKSASYDIWSLGAKWKSLQHKEKYQDYVKRTEYRTNELKKYTNKIKIFTV